ncbi:MAG: type II secretion system F family protein [Armatimonadetes bacterium]|nr:type II secretion system F family protein [Armatimonadota bacterium]
MPTYAYSVRDTSGAVIPGTVEAESEGLLRRRLTEQGFTVVDIKETKGAKRRNPAAGFGRVRLNDMAMFCRQFSTMIDAGVSLVRCLSVLAEQTANTKLKRIIIDLQSEVEAGQMLSRALGKYPGVFNNLFIGLIRAGEIGGVLEESLQRLAGFLEKDQELRRKVKGAMMYPMIIMIVAFVIVTGLVTFVLPKFMTLFTDLGVKEFPGPTRLLMGLSHFMTSKWYFMIAIIIGFVVAIRLFGKTRVGRRILDRAKLKAPVFGKLNHRIALARFSRTLGTLLSSGVPILQALETVAGTVSNEIISDAVLEARARIREGDRIGDPLQRSKLFPPMVVQMISIGEESGSLDPMLAKVADFYEAEVDAALQGLTSAIEPLLIVFMGGAVGFIVIAMFLPLVAVVQSLTGGGAE